MAAPRPPRHYFRRLSLRSILLIVAFIVMLLPVVGFYFLGIYQSALIRQTERQLVTTGDVIAAQFRPALRQAAQGYSYREVCGPIGSRAYNQALQTGERLLCYGRVADAEFHPIYDGPRLVIDRQPVLDLAIDPILDVEPDPTDVARRPRPAVAEAAQGMQQTVIDTRIYTLASLRVLDHTGQIIASSNPDALWQSFEQVDEVQRALRGEAVSVLRAKFRDSPASPLQRWMRARPYRVNVAVPIMFEDRVLGVVYLGRTPNSISAVLWNKWPALLAGILAVLVIVVVLTFGAAFILVRPLRQLVRQSEDAARGARGAVQLLKRPGTQEVAALSVAVTTMAHRLEERAAYIEGFAAQVSHEFKTPLTAIQGAVELLAEHGEEMRAEEKAKFLSNMAADSSRLERLVTRLLELARADTMEPEGGERADLIATLQAVAERSAERGQPIQLDLGKLDVGKAALAPLWVKMGPDTLASVLLNMLDNAYQHAGPKTKVQLTLAPQSSAVRLTVADQGPGISPSNAAKIFAPFFTTARTGGGTGLGLALVRSLLQSAGGSIALTPPPTGFATAFSLSMPYALDRSDTV